MNYYQSRYEGKVLQYIAWACSSHGKCSQSELNDRFRVGNVMETCATLVKQGKLEREGMFEFNYSIPSFNTVTCEHRIDAKLSRAYREQLPQRNAFRVETVPLMDRCVLKVPNHWNKASKDRVFADIVNGFILDYGQCSGNCPMCNDERV